MILGGFLWIHKQWSLKERFSFEFPLHRIAIDRQL